MESKRLNLKELTNLTGLCNQTATIRAEKIGIVRELQKLNGVKTYIYPVTDHQIKKMIEFQNTKCIKATIPQLKELTGLTNNQITWPTGS